MRIAAAVNGQRYSLAGFYTNSLVLKRSKPERFSCRRVVLSCYSPCAISILGGVIVLLIVCVIMMKNLNDKSPLCWLSSVLFFYAQVLEETGFDVSKLLKQEDYIEFIFRQQRVRLYIVAGVSDDTAFAPLTKKEISVCI